MVTKQQKSLMCPFLMWANRMPQGYPNIFCEQDECALWNPHLGCCGLIATGIIQGIEVARQEAAGWLEST